MRATTRVDSVFKTASRSKSEELVLQRCFIGNHSRFTRCCERHHGCGCHVRLDAVCTPQVQNALVDLYRQYVDYDEDTSTVLRDRNSDRYQNSASTCTFAASFMPRKNPGRNSWRALLYTYLHRRAEHWARARIPPSPTRCPAKARGGNTLRHATSHDVVLVEVFEAAPEV